MELLLNGATLGERLVQTIPGLLGGAVSIADGPSSALPTAITTSSRPASSAVAADTAARRCSIVGVADIPST